MVDKVHYQAAAAEVADGNIDQALWIKVTAESPGLDEATHKAMYLQLRAGELAAAKIKLGVRRFMPRTWWHWVLYLPAAYFVAAAVATPFDSYNHPMRSEYVFFPVVLALFALPFILKAVWPKT